MGDVCICQTWTAKSPRAEYFNVRKFYLKQLLRKIIMQWESGGIDNIERAEWDGYMSVHYSIRFTLYMFRIFHNNKAKKSLRSSRR